MNVISDKIVNFLNLCITLCKFSGKLIFSMYYKPTNVYSYLLCGSNHPPHIFENIPFGLFLTIRRICTFFSDYLYFSRRLYFYLLKRGYKAEKLHKISNCVSKLERNSLLEYKEKNNIFDNNQKNFFFKQPYDLNLNKSHLDLNGIFKENKLNSLILKNYNLNIIYSKQFSIGDLFINNFKNTNYNFHYTKCLKKSCMTCFFADTNPVKMLNNFPLFIKNNSNCKTEACIYLISCNRCKNFFYVGQTGSIKDRFYNHIRDITKFKAFITFTSVSTHFNLIGHNFLLDLSFIIIKNCDKLKDLDIRLANENYYIHLFKRLELSLINDTIPNIKNINFYKCLDILK